MEGHKRSEANKFYFLQTMSETHLFIVVFVLKSVFNI